MSELSCLHGSKRYVACDDVSRATPLGRGRDNKNDIRVKRRKGNRKNPPFYLLSRISEFQNRRSYTSACTQTRRRACKKNVGRSVPSAGRYAL